MIEDHGIQRNDVGIPPLMVRVAMIAGQAFQLATAAMKAGLRRNISLGGLVAVEAQRVLSLFRERFVARIAVVVLLCMRFHQRAWREESFDRIVGAG